MLASAQVRARVQALLLGQTAAGTRVLVGRSWPLAEAELPAIKLAITGEAVEAADMHWPALQEHSLALEVRAFVRDVDDAETAMDDITEQVLSVLFGNEADASLDPLPNCLMELSGIDRAVRDAEGEAATGAVAVRLAITFQTVSNNPSTLV